MDFFSGNSGNKLYETVTKVGEGCQQEGAFCQYLGETVAPKVFAIIPNGYVMERLERPRSLEHALLKIETLLKNHVWNRPALESTTDEDWRDKLRMYGVDTPDWVTVTPCLVHGDPTVSNFMHRPFGGGVLIDPRAPRSYIPQTKETDMGRILQSFFRWECAAYGWPSIHYRTPVFFFEHESMKQARFWCGAAAARIQYLETSRPNPRESVLSWCQSVREVCHV